MKKIVAQKELIDQILHDGNDILTSFCMQYEKELPMHAGVSAFEHSLSVAYYALYLVKKNGWKADERSLVRGALLHDYFLYDWHHHEKWHKLHGFRHAHTALKRAEADFRLNPIEKDIIAKHMFPVNLAWPRYKESFIVDWADKVCAHYEIHKGSPKVSICSAEQAEPVFRLSHQGA